MLAGLRSLCSFIFLEDGRHRRCWGITWPRHRQCTVFISAAPTECEMEPTAWNTADIKSALFSFQITPVLPIPSALRSLPARSCPEPGWIEATNPKRSEFFSRAAVRAGIGKESLPHPAIAAISSFHRSPSTAESRKWNLSLPYYAPPMSKNWAAFLYRFNHPNPQVGPFILSNPGPQVLCGSHIIPYSPEQGP